jgi:RimJ/RimL family protein N-acetyltransferase
MKTYRTRRLTLRPYSLNDYPAWAHAYLSVLPRKSKHDWIPSQKLPVNRREFARIVRRHQRLAKADRTYVWAIFDRKSGELLGHVDISVISRGALQFANLGYRILNRHWRKGYASEALTTMIPATLRELRLNRLEAVIDLDNRPSIALARSVGLNREGVRRSYYYQDLGWADQVVYTAIRQDFRLKTLHPEK